jgi:predicted permease
MNDLLRDVRYALRVLRKSPAFTVVATLTLMLGIGANVVVFGVTKAVLLRPLHVSAPENLFQLRLQPWTSGKLLTTSYPAFQDLRQRNTTFSDLAGFYGFCEARLKAGDVVKSVYGSAVTGNYFALLGVQPELGRFITEADERGPGSAPYLVLSHELWRSAFNADHGVVGRTVRLGKDPFTIIGVAPARFHGTEKFSWPDYWIPIVNYFRPDQLQNRTANALTVLGRLKPGVTPRQAAENLSAVAAQLATEHPKTDTGTPLRLIRPGLQGDSGDVVRGFLWSVSGLALLILAAACANLASLFAARAADRSRQLAVRVAIGATRWRLVREVMTEAMVVSLIGGAAALVAGALLLRVLNHWYSGGRAAITVDAGVYIVALLLTVVSGLAFGMIPARQIWRSSPLQAMKSGASDAMPRRRFTLRDLLLGTQIAICTLLVTASLVAVRSMVRLLHAPLGFQPHGALLAELDLSEVEGEVPLEAKKAMLDAVRTIPGVTAAGTVSRVPFNGGLRGVPIFRPGTTDFTPNNAALSPYVFTISPGYFEAAGTRLLAGRDVSWHDTAQTPHVAVVNRTFARSLWADEAALGRHFILSGRLTEVVGVAEDGKYHNMQEPPQPAAYLALSQNERSSTIFIVRSPRTRNELAPALERAFTAFEPNAIVRVRNWSELLEGENALLPARASVFAMSVMGGLAAMLALTGIFGMAAYNVSRRLKELGIRVALGARTKHVMSTAVGRPIALLGIGSSVGLVWGVLATRLLGQVVYQPNPRDPMVLAGAVLTMALLGIAASALPAVRALAIDPAKLLREE